MAPHSPLHTPTTVTPSRRPASSRDFARSPAHVPEPYEATTHRPQLMVSRPGSESGRSRAAPSPKPQWSIRSAGRPAAPSPSPSSQWSAARQHHPLADVELDQLARELASRDVALRDAREQARHLGGTRPTSPGPNPNPDPKQASQGAARLLGEIDSLQSGLSEADANAAALRSQLGAARREPEPKPDPEPNHRP